MKLIVVRHGETKENAGRIIQGQRPGTLSQKGEEQVKRLAKKLKHEKFSAIYTSDLNRCVKTAEAILKEKSVLPLLQDKRLREFSFGIFEGLPFASKKHRFSKLGLRLPLGWFGIETPQRVEKRVVDFVNDIFKQHKNDTLVIVTHGGPIRVLRAVIENREFSGLFSEEVDNCSVWNFTVDNPL